MEQQTWELANKQLGGLLVATDLTLLGVSGGEVKLGGGRTRATVPGLYLCGFLTPPVDGADLRAALEASCLRGALPPVDFL